MQSARRPPPGDGEPGPAGAGVSAETVPSGHPRSRAAPCPGRAWWRLTSRQQAASQLGGDASGLASASVHATAGAGSPQREIPVRQRLCLPLAAQFGLSGAILLAAGGFRARDALQRRTVCKGSQDPRGGGPRPPYPPPYGPLSHPGPGLYPDGRSGDRSIAQSTVRQRVTQHSAAQTAKDQRDVSEPANRPGAFHPRAP